MSKTFEPADIFLNEECVVLEDGTRLPITNWFDLDGEDCEPEDAVTCVAGPDPDGMWLTIEVFPEDVAKRSLH